jgi:hypothetical protein
MNEAKHTPWHVETHLANPQMARVVGPKFRAMPECEGGGWYTDMETARKIAAGDDLLAALEEMVTAHSMKNVGLSASMRRLDAILSARAAIAKARGEQ